MSGGPLRPELYDRLIRLFHHVRIGNEGAEMISRPYPTGDGDDGLHIDSWGETYYVNCPYCNDTRQRLAINYRWGLRDPHTNSRNLWMAHCFNEECLKDYDRQLILFHEVFADVGDGSQDVLIPGKPGPSAPVPVVWPPELTPLHQLPLDHPACQYLRDRNFDPVLLSQQLGLTYCTRSTYPGGLVVNRIVIPIVMNGEPRGWTGRYLGEPPSNLVPKYFHMPGMKKSEVLYNFDNARHYPYVVVCEGCTDVWRVGPQSVALLGKTASPIQRTLLDQHWGNGAIVILLDSDAQDNAQELSHQLGAAVARRVVVRPPDGKDPGDLTTAELDQLIQTSAQEQGVDLLALRQEGVPAANQPTADTSSKNILADNSNVPEQLSPITPTYTAGVRRPGLWCVKPTPRATAAGRCLSHQ